MKSNDDEEMLAYDECPQVELEIVPFDLAETELIRVAFDECNMMNPDSDDSQDEDEEELFTQEYF